MAAVARGQSEPEPELDLTVMGEPLHLRIRRDTATPRKPISTLVTRDRISPESTMHACIHAIVMRAKHTCIVLLSVLLLRLLS